MKTYVKEYYNEMYKPIIENPICLIINEIGVSCYFNGMKEPLYIAYQIFFRNIIHGFIIIKNNTKNEYKTHGMIYGIEISKTNDIHIFEVGKSNPWIFNKNGQLIRCAQFSETDLTDKIYLETKYGISPTCNIEEANQMLVRCLK